MKRTLVFTATYNERANVDTLLDRIWQAGPDYDVLIVDDNSPDGTGEHLDARAAADPRLHVVHRPGKLGLGTAHQLGMLYAVQHGYEQLVTMDADLSHDPEVIPQLLAKLADADLVIGSRYAPGGSSDYTGYRHFLSVSANTLARSMLGVPTHEFTTSFRAFRVEMLRTNRSAKLKAGGYSYFMETVFRLHRAGFRVAEVPIQFRDRLAGVSKIPQFEIFNGVYKLLWLSASRLARERSEPATAVDATCRGCASPYLMEYFPPSEAAGRTEAEGYRCSTMTHHSKPQIALCLQCGLMQVPKHKQPQDLVELYADVEDPLYLENVAAREITFDRLYERLAPLLGPPGSMLEVGAYCGLFLRVAERHGWKAEGVEPSRWATTIARERYGATVHEGTLHTAREHLHPPYDAVVAWDVLEHLEHPFDLMIRANHLLKDDGVFAFSTLDVHNWFPRVAGKTWPWWMDMHLYYFTQPLLRRWLERAGFETVHISKYRHYASPSYLARKGTTLLPAPLDRLTSGLTDVLPTDFGIPVSFGDIVLVVARKRSHTKLAPGALGDRVS